jgi:hypothetical protein
MVKTLFRMQNFSHSENMDAFLFYESRFKICRKPNSCISFTVNACAQLIHSLLCSAAGTNGTTAGVYSPPAFGQGPSANDMSGGTKIFPVAGTVKRAVILACCWLLALYLSA